MKPPKILVVYYSDTSTTQRVAANVAQALGADLERIHLQKPLTYRQKIWRSITGRTANIQALHHNLDYVDLVVIATPVWAWTMSAPIRTFLKMYRPQLKKLAVIVTCGGAGTHNTISNIEVLVGHKSMASVALTEQHRNTGKDKEMTAHFIDNIKQSLPLIHMGDKPEIAMVQ